MQMYHYVCTLATGYSYSIRFNCRTLALWLRCVSADSQERLESPLSPFLEEPELLLKVHDVSGLAARAASQVIQHTEGEAG